MYNGERLPGGVTQKGAHRVCTRERKPMKGGGSGRIPFVRGAAEGRDGGGDQIEFGFWPLFRFLVGCLV